MRKVVPLFVFAILVYIAHNEGWLDGTPLALHPSLEADLDTFTADMGEQALLTRYPDLNWDCYPEQSDLGERVCTAPIRAWNGVLAKYTAFFFNKRDRLRMVKLNFPEASHAELIGTIAMRHGQSIAVPGRKDVHGKPIVMWKADKGMIAASENVTGDGESTVTWVSGQGLLESMLQRMLN